MRRRRDLPENAPIRTGAFQSLLADRHQLAFVPTAPAVEGAVFVALPLYPTVHYRVGDKGAAKTCKPLNYQAEPAEADNLFAGDLRQVLFRELSRAPRGPYGEEPTFFRAQTAPALRVSFLEKILKHAE